MQKDIVEPVNINLNTELFENNSKNVPVIPANSTQNTQPTSFQPTSFQPGNFSQSVLDVKEDSDEILYDKDNYYEKKYCNIRCNATFLRCLNWLLVFFIFIAVLLLPASPVFIWMSNFFAVKYPCREVYLIGIVVFFITNFIALCLMFWKPVPLLIGFYLFLSFCLIIIVLLVDKKIRESLVSYVLLRN